MAFEKLKQDVERLRSTLGIDSNPEFIKTLTRALKATEIMVKHAPEIGCFDVLCHELYALAPIGDVDSASEGVTPTRNGLLARNGQKHLTQRRAEVGALVQALDKEIAKEDAWR